MWQEAQGLSERTITERATVIRHMLRTTGEAPLDVTATGIIRFTSRKNITATSKATYHASVRAYCAWLVRAELRADDPSLKTPRPKRPKGQPRPVHDAQLSRIIAATNRRRTRAMVLLGALAGLRVHEIAKVRGEDFDLEIGVLTVTGKGGKTSVIALHEALFAEAYAWPREGYWFPNYTDNKNGLAGQAHIRGHAVTRAIGEAMHRSGMQGKPHQLRHWYGTTLLADGADLRLVQTMMRHESPATTAIYTQVDLAQQRVAMARLHLPVAA